MTSTRTYVNISFRVAQTQENTNQLQPSLDLCSIQYRHRPPCCWIALSSRFAALSSIVAALCRARFRTGPPPLCFPQFPLIIFANTSSGTSRSPQSSSVHGTPLFISLINLRFTRCRIRSIVTWSNHPFRSCDVRTSLAIVQLTEVVGPSRHRYVHARPLCGEQGHRCKSESVDP